MTAPALLLLSLLLACASTSAPVRCPEPEPSAARADPTPADPLPSWNDTASKQAIVDFVNAVSEAGSPDFVPIEQRIAVFDNDGTLWLEQPIYPQLHFVLDRVRELAAEHPAWKTTQPFGAALDNDLDTLSQGGHRMLFELLLATHTGMSTQEFASIVERWLAEAKHPKYERPYTELVYAPMLELLDYLRANDFEVYIVSGGGVAFMRVFAEDVYGVPPERVIGSAVVTEYAVEDGEPVIVRKPELLWIDDEQAKPINIERTIGRRPILAVGNSDGDLQMIEWTTAGSGRRLGLILHHTDGEREYAYDRDSSVGRLDRALDLAPARGWVVIDMKRDWSRVFPATVPPSDTRRAQ